jgi:hypothetical protein
MCITNDNAIRNGNKRSDVTEKKILKREKEHNKEGNDEKVVTIEENKEKKD